MSTGVNVRGEHQRSPENQLNVYVLKADRSCLEKSNFQGSGVCSGGFLCFQWWDRVVYVGLSFPITKLYDH